MPIPIYGSPSAFKPNGLRTDRGHGLHHFRAPRAEATVLEYKEIPEIRSRPGSIRTRGSALAPYFSVVFFKRCPAEDYRIYSPYQDRPRKVIDSTNAVNDMSQPR